MTDLAISSALTIGMTILLQSSVLLALGLGCVWALRRRSASLRCLAARATLAGVGLSVCLALASAGRPALWRVPLPALPHRPHAPLPASEAARAPENARAEAARSDAPRAEPGEIAAPSAGLRDAPASTWGHADSPDREPAPRLEPPTERVSSGGTIREPAASPARVQVLEGGREPLAGPSSARLARAAVAIWLGGAMLGLCWLALGQWQVWRLRKRATPVSMSTIEAHREVLQVLGGGSRRAPQVLESESVSGMGGGPFLCGLLSPAIVLPRGFAARLEPESLRAVLAHEAAHAHRRDLWWSTPARLACALLWPQPLVWALARHLEAAQEEACDQAVLSAGCAPHHYAACLLGLAEQLQARPLRSARGLGVVPSRSALARRVRQILGGAGDAPPSFQARAAAIAGVGAALAFVPGLSGAPAQAPRVAAASIAQPSPGASSSRAPVRAEVKPEAVSPDEVAGVVLDPNGRPAPRAWVVINEDASNDRLLSARADGRGRFRFAVANLAAGGTLSPADGDRFTCWATAYAPGGAIKRVDMEAGKWGVIRLEREVRVRGVVRDRSGRPLAGVPVWLTGAGRAFYGLEERYVWVPQVLAPALTVRTDSRGRYEVRGVPASSTASLEIGDPRFVRRGFSIPLSGPVTVVPAQVLRPASFVEGRVLGLDGRPRAGVEVSANTGRGISPEGEAGWSDAVTGRDGAFRIGSLPPSRVTVRIQDRSGAGVAPALPNIVLKPGSTVRVGDVRLRRGGVVRGRVVDRDSGRPLSGALVSGSGAGTYASVASDARGRYSLRLPAGKGSIGVSAVPRGYLYPTLAGRSGSLPVTLAEGGTQTYTVRLQKGLSARGAALAPDGKPAAEAWLVAERVLPAWQHTTPGSEKFGRVAADGSWSIGGLTPGRHTLKARGAWRVVSPREFTVPSASPEPLQVRLRPIKLPVVEGRVVTSGGQPLPGARVKIHVRVPWGSRSWVSMTEERLSDREGRFRIGLPREDARVWLEAALNGYKYLSGGQVTSREADSVTEFAVRDIVMAPGKESSGAFGGPSPPFLRGPSPRPSTRPAAISSSRRAEIASFVGGGASIRGRVLYEDGRPARVGVWLNAVDEEAEKIRKELNWRSGVDSRLLSRLRTTVQTRADGSFEARGLAPSTFSVMPRREIRGFVARRVPDVRARRGASVRARDIILLRGAVVRIRIADARTGRLLRGQLPLGTYNEPRFDLMSPAGIYPPGPDGVGYLTVPAGVASVGLWRNPDGRRPRREIRVTPLDSRYAWTYDLSPEEIEVSLDGGPRQKKRDGRLSIPIAPGQTRDMTFFLNRLD